MNRCVLLALLALAMTSCVAAKTPASDPALALSRIERADWGRHFQAAGVQGTLVLLKHGSAQAQVYNPAGAATPYLPASTFKVVNALIALETGVASGRDEVFPWDGVKRSPAAWNKDLTLREAFAVSSVPTFQVIARKIGTERMARYVREARYGNQNIGGAIDTFWLQGDLNITALQQVDFLQRLNRGQLPFSKKNMDTVKDLMVVDKGADWVLRAKTGWVVRDKPNVGWWVGWLERRGEVWYFALAIDLDKAEQAKARQDIVRAVLKQEGLLP